MNDGSTRPAASPNFDLNGLDMVMVLRVAGGLVILAAVLTAIHILDGGGSYATWSAISTLVPTVSIGALILVCAERLANRDFSTIAQAIMAVASIAVVATIALCIKDLTSDGGSIWDVLDDLVFYSPIGFPVLLWFSSRPQPDRALGRIDKYGMYVAAALIVLAVIVAIHDVTDAEGDEIWVLLSSLTLPLSLGLLLLAFTLGGPMPSSVTIPESKLRDWLFFGGIAVIVLGVLLAFHAMDQVFKNGFWVLLAVLGVYVGMGTSVIIASNTLHARFAMMQPYLRGLAVGAIACSIVGGLYLTLDTPSDKFWVFWDQTITPIGFGALALGIYEVTQRLRTTSGEPDALAEGPDALAEGIE